LPVWYGWLYPPRVLAPTTVIVLLALPLFAPLRGLLHARRYTVAWSLFVSLIYFIHGIVEAYSNPQVRWLALGEVALSLCWMSGGTLFIRATSRARTPRNPAP
jgi:uncharacterized membrane protein